MTKIREAIGLDIGSHAIKLVHVRKKADSVEILNYRIIKNPKKDTTKTSVCEAIIPFLKQAKGNISIIASIEGHQVFTRVFKLPAVGKSKLAKIVGYEAQQQVPFPITEVAWAYQCVRKVSAEEADVVLVAVKKDVVSGFLNSYKQLGVSIEDVVAPIIGLFNLLEYQLEEQNQATLILDMGAKTTNIVVLEKQNLWFRTVPLGGDVITQAIGQEFNLNQIEAVAFKEDKGYISIETSEPLDSTNKKISSCIVRSINRLTGEISRSMEVYTSSFNSLGIRRVIVTGGTSFLKNLDKFLAKKFRADVLKLDVLKGFDISPTIEKEKINKDARLLGVSLGLALQGLGLGRFGLSLLPKDVARKQQLRKKRGYMISAVSLLMFLGFSFAGYNAQISNMYRANIQELIAENKAVDFNKKELSAATQQLNKVKRELDIISGVVNARVLWIDILLDLEEIIPKDVWLTGIKPAKEEEIVSGTISSRAYSKAGKDLGQVEAEYIYAKNYIDLELHGKTAGLYQQIVAFRDALDKSKYFASGVTEVILASPPKEGVRDFVIKVRLRTREKLES